MKSWKGKERKKGIGSSRLTRATRAHGPSLEETSESSNSIGDKVKKNPFQIRPIEAGLVSGEGRGGE
jgi:hypothetical protein